MISDKNTLLIAENFYSVQAEGFTTGYPAYFIRLANCNLNCGLNIEDVNKYKKGIITDTALVPNLPNSTWVCDSIPVWTTGTPRTYQWLIDQWKAEGLYDDIKNGIIHIIWTGGEPTIPMHQKAISEFHQYWADQDFDDKFTPYVEIETNGTFYIGDDLFSQLDQINCSAKLSNSGMKLNARIVPEAIKRIMEHLNYQFKFVISTEDDIQEILDTYVIPYKIPYQYFVCMPGLDDQKDYFERTKFVMEMAKKYKFIGLSRQHIAAWNKTTGV